MPNATNDDEESPDESAETEGLGALERGSVIEGKYRVERIIGRGGMGVVLQATHLNLGEQVALKFLQVKDEDVEGDFRARFALEARVCAKLRNDHIARVHDVGIWRGKIPFMVMDYLEGIDLRRELKLTGRLTVARAVDYVVQICEGLAEAHAQGIVHRDLKPPNIFITKRHDGSDLLKVLDFGISKWASEAGGVGELTKTGMMLGSPKYMSPEQLNGVTIDARADVWSIGAMLYTMLTGRPPYDFPQVTQTFMAIATGARPPAPSTIEPGVPPELDALVLGCLTREKSERVQNVAELAGTALEAIDSPFAAQVRDVLYGVLEPGSLSSSRPRAAALSLTTGTHAAFAIASEPTSITPGAVRAPSLASRAPERPRVRARTWLALGAGVALAASLAFAAGPGAPLVSTAGPESARVRGFTPKTLVRESTSLAAVAPRPTAMQARAWTRATASAPERVASAPVAVPAPSQVEAGSKPQAPVAAHASNALDDRQ